MKTIEDRLAGLPEAPEPSTELANKKHRAKIEAEVLAALKVEFDGEDARDLNEIVLQAIKEGRIPHVSIAY